MIRLAALMLCAGVSAAVAVEPGEQLSDPALERRARAISAELRCLVCQNQSIDDSDAPLARDLRLLVRQRIRSGESDGQVRDYLVARYGDFILLRPPLSASTMLLWLTPVLALLAGGWVAIRRGREQTDLAGAARLSADEEAQLDQIVRARD